MQHNLVSGPGYLWRGLKLLRHPQLRPFVLIPLLLNTLIFIGLLALVVHWWQHLVGWIDHLLPNWLRWLNWLLWILFTFATILSITYLFNIIANLLGAPFNSLLSAKVEELMTSKISKNSWCELISDIPRVCKHELQKIAYYLPRALLALILFFIPVVQIAAPIIWFVFNAWMMALQYLDYPMDNQHLSFQAVKQQLHKNRFLNLSFGASVMLMTMIPIINFLVMPTAVVGATLHWLDLNS